MDPEGTRAATGRRELGQKQTRQGAKTGRGASRANGLGAILRPKARRRGARERLAYFQLTFGGLGRIERIDRYVQWYIRIVLSGT